MDLGLIGNFLNERLTSRKAVEEAADVIGVSIATMYRYKSSPDAISLGQICKLSQRLGLPLAHGAVWTQDSIVGSERRRLQLEIELAKTGGTRLTTIPAYTVNDELPEVTQLLLQEDYGAKAKRFDAEVLAVRAERRMLYESGKYVSWEIWKRIRVSRLSEWPRAVQINPSRTPTGSNRSVRRKFQPHRRPSIPISNALS